MKDDSLFKSVATNESFNSSSKELFWWIIIVKEQLDLNIDKY
jgi:hypothetical protein